VENFQITCEYTCGYPIIHLSSGRFVDNSTRFPQSYQHTYQQYFLKLFVINNELKIYLLSLQQKWERL
jgi:hypothetical protein